MIASARPSIGRTIGDRRHGPRPACGFTVVELMVVIAVIALILAIGVPAFNSMTVQQRMSKTQQLLNGMLTRTHVTSASDKNLAAVRIMPAEWHLDNEADAGAIAGRQIITSYTWRHTYAANPARPDVVLFDERFERIEDGPTNLLPPDTWLAPIEAFALNDPEDRAYLSDLGSATDLLGNLVLGGTIGTFELNAGRRGEELLDADDFLIVFDPEVGVLRSADGLRRNSWRVLGYDPRDTGVTAGLEIDGERRRDNGNIIEPFTRHNFTGAVIYRREPFVTFGASSDSAVIQDRRAYLRDSGRPFYVDRTGGSLIPGAEQ